MDLVCQSKSGVTRVWKCMWSVRVELIWPPIGLLDIFPNQHLMVFCSFITWVGLPQGPRFHTYEHHPMLSPVFQARVPFSDLLVWQKVNHFPEAKQLTRKDLLKKHLVRYQVCSGREGQVF